MYDHMSSPVVSELANGTLKQVLADRNIKPHIFINLVDRLRCIPNLATPHGSHDSEGYTLNYAYIGSGHMNSRETVVAIFSNIDTILGDDYYVDLINPDVTKDNPASAEILCRSDEDRNETEKGKIRLVLRESEFV